MQQTNLSICPSLSELVELISLRTVVDVEAEQRVISDLVLEGSWSILRTQLII